ncbi:hypothetical protein Y032_0150g2767 [Ancylostoma ceylanicum]|uniref:Uncharacterized protein n=1 Tax=Ancylostoma ceylanicum TaxID=53326 RepID=A0A016T0F0_9BILA|nr:hypothetical protein Y032_0150g2767 [Ancylostoma ceylanicum]
MSSNTRGTCAYAGTVNVSVPSSPVKRSNFAKKTSSNVNKANNNANKANSTANNSNSGVNKPSNNANKTNNGEAKQQTTPEFHFQMDKMTKEEMLSEIEKSQAEDDDQPLLSIQRSQTETNIEEKALVRSMTVCVVCECTVFTHFSPICP